MHQLSYCSKTVFTADDKQLITGLPWVWGFPCGFPWVWVWCGYGDCDESPWVLWVICGDF